MKTNNFKLSYAIAPVTMVVLMLLLLVLTLAGCYVPYDPYHPHSPRGGEPIRAPMIEAVKASCHYNYTYDDYMWYFDAWVHYPRHDYEEVSDVYVEVYDGPYLVDWFPLYHDREKYWTSSWIEGIETDLWCGNYYEIDFIAFDYFGAHDIVTATPYY